MNTARPLITKIIMKGRRFIALAMASMLALTISAQDKAEVNLGADIVSRYIWRGSDCGSAAVQPTLGVSYKGLSLAAWGSTGIVDSEDTKEFDLTLSYSISGLTFGITDYWFDDLGSKYFKYAAHETAHTFEAFIGYDFNIFSVQWFTNFAGRDGVTRHGHRAYSSYAEVNVPFKALACDWTGTVGCTPYGTTYYSNAKRFAIINVALKATHTFEITDKFSPDVFASVIANPRSEAAYFVCGVSLKTQF